jgi:hypothetical protein
MGRPIKSVYFGNRNTNGVGGEGVSTANVFVAGTGYYSANAAVTFTAPQIAGGATATGTLTLNGNGNVSGVLITSAGSGYTSAPTATVTGANTSPAIVANITLSSSTADAISANAWVTGGVIGKAADIISQRSSRRYRVRNADGTDVCRLVPRLPAAAGEMALIATDSASGTYYVTKLESRTACLIPGTGTQFAANSHVKWTLDSAEANVSVVITNL